MASRTEQDFACVIPYEFALFVYADRVGRRFLNGKGYIVFHFEHFFENLGYFFQSFLEIFDIFGRNGEVKPGFFIAFAIEGSFNQMFIESGSDEIPVYVEIDQAFRGISIV